MLIVEVGFKLEKNFEYYDKLLKDNGLINDFNVTTHDLYYTNKQLDGLSEKEMKNSCIRLRSCNNEDYQVHNELLNELNINIVKKEELKDYEKNLLKYGYKIVCDTIKKDHHYYKDSMNSKIQLQEIKDIGLLVYYDNSNYYKYDLETERQKLIDELNSFGFNFNYETLGLDKLRTLYYKKEMFSNNQNG